MLAFDANTHTYRYNHVVVPSVTTILKPVNNYSAIPKEILKAAAQFGINVHAAVDLYNRKELDETALDSKLWPYLRGYQRFLANTGFEVATSEQRVFNLDLWYAGTCDFTGTWKSTTWVVDIKSGKVPKSVGPQLAAYQHALPERPRRRLCVALKPDDYTLHECSDVADFEVFKSCLNIWRFNHDKTR